MERAASVESHTDPKLLQLSLQWHQKIAQQNAALTTCTEWPAIMSLGLALYTLRLLGLRDE